jgi:hypothetical protein
MNLARARELVAALPISDAERDAILNALSPTMRIHNQAWRFRLALQEKHHFKREQAVKAAVRKFAPFVEDAVALEKAVRNPNGLVRKISAIPISESH